MTVWNRSMCAILLASYHNGTEQSAHLSPLGDSVAGRDAPITMITSTVPFCRLIGKLVHVQTRTAIVSFVVSSASCCVKSAPKERHARNHQHAPTRQSATVATARWQPLFIPSFLVGRRPLLTFAAAGKFSSVDQHHRVIQCICC